jgi:Tol biopolymer transport system component
MSRNHIIPCHFENDLRNVGLHAKRPIGVLIVLATMSAVVLALLATPALALVDNCPNAALRAQNNSIHLSDCRAYELVNNPFKEGFAPVLQAYTDDGVFSYKSSGNFADNGMGAPGNQYVATRSATGWQTTAPAPSGPAYVSTTGGADALSADLRSSIWLMRLPEQATNVSDLYLRGSDGTFTRIGPGANPATVPPGVPGTTYSPPLPLVLPLGVSADLSHVLFVLQSQNGYPGDTSTGSSSLYEYVGTGNDRPQLVGVDNAGHQLSQRETCANGMSPDGRVVVFTPDCQGGSPSVWARINATTSVEASASECTRGAADPGGPCTAPSDASFAGMAVDGSRVFFTTAQQLVNGDIDATVDLYECDIPPGMPVPTATANSCAALRQVSNTAAGAQVESVAAVSDDGSRVYFVGLGVLAGNLGANDAAAVRGDHNLYVWQQDSVHPLGRTTFVGKLENNDVGTSQTTADGRYLVFSTATALVNRGQGADSDTAIDVYRYDAETGRLARLSISTSGDSGNEPGLDAMTTSIPSLVERRRTVITGDGATVVFLTIEALSPNDDNGTADVYAWHNGQVSLISSGQPSLDNPATPYAWVSASGTDIYFNATAQLTPADGDTNPDVYDARSGGGFDFTVPRVCSGDACQGEYSTPPGLSASGSTSLVKGSEPSSAVPAFLLRSISAAQRKRLAATGRVSLVVTANTPGTVSAVATMTSAGRSVGVGSARRVMATPGMVTLTVVLSNNARARLAAMSRLIVKVVVSDSKVALPRSVVLMLTHTRARSKAKTTAADDLSSRRVVGRSKGHRS